MKKAVYLLLITFLMMFQGISLAADDLSTHNAYRVTSYNLGAILEVQDDGRLNQSRDFKPLLITGTATDILNSEHEGTVSWDETTSHSTNINGIALSAQYDATQKISVHGAFGFTRNLWTPDSIEYENESSWEANLGIIYNFLGNLSYELHFGYLDTGDLFNDRSSYSDVESIIMISNQLSLSF